MKPNSVNIEGIKYDLRGAVDLDLSVKEYSCEGDVYRIAEDWDIENLCHRFDCPALESLLPVVAE